MVKWRIDFDIPLSWRSTDGGRLIKYVTSLFLSGGGLYGTGFAIKLDEMKKLILPTQFLLQIIAFDLYDFSCEILHSVP